MKNWLARVELLYIIQAVCMAYEFPGVALTTFFFSIFSLSSLIFVYEPLNFKNNPLIFFFRFGLCTLDCYLFYLK